LEVSISCGASVISASPVSPQNHSVWRHALIAPAVLIVDTDLDLSPDACPGSGSSADQATGTGKDQS
jgi:hypothetical protein